jgi:K+-transporting ATPase ATPase A chain
MTWIRTLQLIAFLALLLAITKPLGSYIANVFEGKQHFLSRSFGPLERFIYRFCGVNPTTDQHWTTYAGGCLVFGLVHS